MRADAVTLHSRCAALQRRVDFYEGALSVRACEGRVEFKRTVDVKSLEVNYIQYGGKSYRIGMLQWHTGQVDLTITAEMYTRLPVSAMAQILVRAGEERDKLHGTGDTKSKGDAHTPRAATADG